MDEIEARKLRLWGKPQKPKPLAKVPDPTDRDYIIRSVLLKHRMGYPGPDLRYQESEHSHCAG